MVKISSATLERELNSPLTLMVVRPVLPVLGIKFFRLKANRLFTGGTEATGTAYLPLIDWMEEQAITILEKLTGASNGHNEHSVYAQSVKITYYLNDDQAKINNRGRKASSEQDRVNDHALYTRALQKAMLKGFFLERTWLDEQLYLR